MEKYKKLLLVGSTEGSVHVKNYFELIKDYFDEILIVSGNEIDYCNHITVDFSLKTPIKIIKSINQLKKIIADFSPTLIHAHQANSYAYLVARANHKDIPFVVTTWGSDVLILPKKGGLYKHIVKYSLSNANYITADAKFMIKAIERLGIAKEVILANFGIDYEDIVIPEKENIIYSNRLHNDLYNIDKIISAFSIFVKDNPSWKLVIGANGSNTEKLKEQAKNKLPENSYEFIGFVDKEENKRQYLRAKIWVSVPSSDGTAISLLEAMGYGCIPVVSNLPANKEWITDKKNGIVAGFNLEDDLDKALNLKLKDLQDLNKNIIINKATKKANKAIFEGIYDQIIKH